MSAFEEMGVCPELIRGVSELGWLLPTPIQAEAVPLILGGGDVLAAAETGSGKTGAFALPVLQVVHEAVRRRGRSAPAGGGGKTPEAEARQCVVSAEDRDPVLSVAPDGLRCQSRSEKLWGGARGTIGAFAGRVYYEVVLQDEGLARMGWATTAASLQLGTDKHSWGYGSTGKKSHQRQFDTYGEPFGQGDIMGVLLDSDTGAVSFTKNGKDMGQAFTLPPFIRGQALYPAICLKDAEVVVNFGGPGNPALAHTPAGYTPLAQAGSQCVAGAANAGAGDGSGGGGIPPNAPLCIILEPSRDLAEQTARFVDKYKKFLVSPSLRSLLLVGGVDPAPQIRQLTEGAEIVVGTPGRILDFVETKKMDLSQTKFLVLDEADRLIDNLDAVMSLFNRLPKSGSGLDRLQVLMFSATLHTPEVQDLADKITQNPVLADLKGKDAVPETVDHTVIEVDPREDKSWLQSSPQVFTDNVHALDRVDAAAAAAQSPEALSEGAKRLKQRMLKRVLDQYKVEQAIIFCRTNFDCDNLERFMLSLDNTTHTYRGKRETGKEGAYSCVVLGGARSMDERRRALQGFKDGDVRFLICTDVAARGIDVSGLPVVINMTLPDKAEDYIHRSGRVGRADALGLAISIVSKVPEKVWFCSVKGYRPWLQPKPADVRTQDKKGHTIWYDEQQLLGEIEKRLGGIVGRMGPDLSLPPDVAERLGGGGGGGEVYGQTKGGGMSKEISEHLEAIRGSVESLASLEWQAQTSFNLLLRKKWAGTGAHQDKEKMQHVGAA